MPDITLSSCLFSLSCSRTHADLHSFPTRRSSDLFVTAARDDLGSMFRGYEVGAVDYIVKPLIPEVLKSKISVFIDRKSTRLNSSHRCISYAVFCLKKKKKHIKLIAFSR